MHLSDAAENWFLEHPRWVLSLAIELADWFLPYGVLHIQLANFRHFNFPHSGGKSYRSQRDKDLRKQQ